MSSQEQLIKSPYEEEEDDEDSLFDIQPNKNADVNADVNADENADVDYELDDLDPVYINNDLEKGSITLKKKDIDDEDSEEDVDEDVDEDFSIKKKDDLYEEDEEDDDDETEDENYLQKFDASLSKRVLNEFYPELEQLNYEEIEMLTTVVRNYQGVVVDVLHKTLPFLTKYEKARILGERTKQLNAGAKPYIEVEPNIIDGYLIALKELEEKKIPFIVKRPLPSGGCEYWRLRDLEIIT